MNTFNLKLDVDKAAKGFRNQVVRIRKGDLNGTILVATLYDHGTKITTSGLTVDFVMLQPDREHYYRATATWSAVNGTASVTLDESYAGSVAGDTDVAYFELRQGTQVIASTENFRVQVLRSATDEGETPAESYDDIIPASVYAWLEEHPEATTTVQDDSLTTAKYKDSSVTTPKLADGSVTTPKLADHAVTDAKLSTTGVLAKANRLLGNALRGTKSGAVVSAADAYAAPPLGLTVHGKSVQDGTPTPSSPVAIDSVESVAAGFAGSNLSEFFTKALNDTAYWYSTSNLVAFGTKLDDGWCRLTSNSANLNLSPIKSALPAIKGGRTYTVMLEVRNATITGNVILYLYTATNSMWNEVSNVSITGNGTYYVTGLTKSDLSSSAITHLRTFLNASNGAFSGDIRLSIYGGSEHPSSYAPPTITVNTIDLQGHELRSLPDGTHDELRVDADGNVTLVQRVGSVSYDGSSDESWTLQTDGARFLVVPEQRGVGPTSNDGVANGYATTVPAGSRNNTWSGARPTLPTYIGACFSIETNGTIQIAPDGTYTLDSFIAWLAAHPTTIVYPLATPVTHDLGTVALPALPAPDATAWAVTDPSTTVGLDYERDTRIAFDMLCGQIAPTEQATATRNHASGDLFMLGGTLVKATTAIASGEAVVIGTNCAATTVAAQLALKANA